MGELERLASSCILPGFEGPTVPDWIRRRLDEGLGGVVLYAWNVESREQLRALTDDLRSERDDLVIAIDEEGGDVTRLEAGTGSSYPGNAALGVVDDLELTERIAASIGAELADVGVNLDFAPVADVNTNPLNPVIGIRSFGSDAELVARHVAAFVRGLQSAGCRRVREALSRVTATRPSTPTSRCLFVDSARAGRARPVPCRDRGRRAVDHDRAHRRPLDR